VGAWPGEGGREGAHTLASTSQSDELEKRRRDRCVSYHWLHIIGLGW
jgi:hypothetical protein